ncbi:MAG: cytochrome C oxidase subunit IV family protein [Bryobacterales bacterium]|nr:cytochrome C oxidase subunit IV family protein [Bryobacterales bacterium]
MQPTVKQLAMVWAALLGFTLVEVGLAFPHFSAVLFLIVLLVLSIGKSALIIGFFMHLKFERRALTLALFPLLIVFVLVLLALLPDAERLREMRF